jgi:polyphosphate kinase
MSPTQIKPKLLKMIERESLFGREGRIILKANSLVDQTIIRALYKASIAGVKIDLIIRGICCLKPKIKSVSENIRVHSIVGKYLEHPRIYWFKNDKVKAYISSADLMPRNLDRRIELMIPIEDEKLKDKLYQILKIQILDNTHRYELQNNGEYLKITPKGGEKIINAQEAYEKYVSQIAKLSQKSSSKHIKLARKVLKEK